MKEPVYLANRGTISSPAWFLICKNVVYCVLLSTVLCATGLAAVFLIGQFFNFMMGLPFHFTFGFLLLTIGILIAIAGYFEYYRERK